MPCFDGRESMDRAFAQVEADKAREEARTERTKRRKVEAMLCGVLSFLDDRIWSGSEDYLIDRVLDQLNYKEMGVTRAELEQWWKQHREEDRRRHQLQARKATARKRAIAASYSKRRHKDDPS